MSKKTHTIVINEQCPEVPAVEIRVKVSSEGGRIWIQPDGFGEKCADDGQGWPIGIEIWQGILRLIIFNDINCEDPMIINLENSKESHRINV